VSKVLILGGDSDFNLGDAAILAAMCASLSRAGASAITITSRKARPMLAAGATTSIRRGISGTADLMAAVRSADLVIIGGGGLFQDDDSRIKMPYWAARIAALRLANSNIVGHSLGVGPLDHPESRYCARVACARMRSVSVRDQFAKHWLERSIARTVPIVPDPAFMLAPAPESIADHLLQSSGVPMDRPIIGVTMRRWFHPLGGFIPHKLRARIGLDRLSNTGALRMTAFLDKFAASLETVAMRLGASLLLLPTYNISHEADSVICRELAIRMRNTVVNMAVIDEPAVYKAVAGKLALMVSGRMHPMILAAAMGTPVVGVAYNGKFGGVLDLLGIGDQMVWFDDVLQESPAKSLPTLVETAISQRSKMHERAIELAQDVDRATRRLIGG
jgi:polysaccharide pyruvyl transferase WcaK-like protein